MEWAELEREIKLGWETENIAEVTSISASTCKIPAWGKEHSDQEEKQSWPEDGLSRAPVHSLLCPLPGPKAEREKESKKIVSWP